MNHAMPVGVLEGLGRFAGNPYRVLDRELTLPPEPVAQRFAFHERHGEPELPGGFAGVQDGEDVGVLQAGGGLDLPLKPLRAERLRQVREEHLEGDRALVPQVVSEVDRGHAAAAQLTLEPVAVREGSAELVEEIGHTRIRPEGRRYVTAPG